MGILLILFFQETNLMNKMQGANFVQILCKFCANEGRAKLAWAMPSAAKIIKI